MYLWESVYIHLRRRKFNSQNDNGGDETDTETSNQTTNNHDFETSGGSLKDATNAEDGASKNDSEATADEISKVSRNDGTKEGTGRENGGGQGLLPRGNAEELLSVLDNNWVLSTEVGVLDVWVLVASVLFDEVVHVQDTTHPTGIISEEDLFPYHEQQILNALGYGHLHHQRPQKRQSGRPER